jgi:very-short-patch-repair endonuclease
VVSREQLLALGLGAGAIDHRVKRGLLHVLHKGVYAVGHRRLSFRGECFAAILACGPGSVLSHRSAAAEWNLLRSSSRRIHMTVPRSRRSVPGLVLHRPRGLPSQDRAEVNGLPVTSVARTILDCAAGRPPRETERAMEQAERLGLFDLRAMHELLGRSGGRRGAATVRAVLAHYDPAAVATKQELERRFLKLCREGGLPIPARNATVAGYQVDGFWPQYGLVAELDGFDPHGGRMAFEDDRVKTAALQLAAYAVVRITWRMLTRDPAGVIALLQAHFARPAPAAARR